MIVAAPVASGTFARRVEHKYWLPPGELDATIERLQTFVPIFRYSSCWWASIRTVCLDTPEGQCYRDYLDGLAVRWKVRIRQYGAQGRFGDRCWCEIKMKNRGISSKRRFNSPLSEVCRLVDGGRIAEESIADQGPETLEVFRRIAWLIRSKRLRPKVRIDYERLSFQNGPDDSVRITLDRNLCFMAAGRPQRGSMQGLILELKYNGLAPPWFDELHDYISLHRAHRFSKYARAVGALDSAVLSGALS